MGLHLHPNRAQVSMNLTNFAEIPLDDLYRTIQEEAARRGTSIAESELIGFVPNAAFEKAPDLSANARVRVADYRESARDSVEVVARHVLCVRRYGAKRARRERRFSQSHRP